MEKKLTTGPTEMIGETRLRGESFAWASHLLDKRLLRNHGSRHSQEGFFFLFGKSVMSVVQFPRRMSTHSGAKTPAHVCCCPTSDAEVVKMPPLYGKSPTHRIRSSSIMGFISCRVIWLCVSKGVCLTARIQRRDVVTSKP